MFFSTKALCNQVSARLHHLACTEHSKNHLGKIPGVKGPEGIAGCGLL